MVPAYPGFPGKEAI